MSGLTASLLPFPVARSGKVLRVDSVFGNDDTASRQRADKPFLTLTAAKTAAQSGDLIYVGPGDYNETNLAKDGVNWFFALGAVVHYTGSTNGGIFDDNGAAVTSIVTGCGVFRKSTSSSTKGVISTANSGTSLSIECRQIINDISGAADCAAVLANGGTVSIRAKEVIADYDALLSTEGSGTLTVHADLVRATGSGGSAIEWSGAGVCNVYADEIEALGDEDAIVTTAGKVNIFGASVEVESATGFTSDGGDIEFTGCKIVCQAASARSGNVSPGSTVTLRNAVLVAGASATNSVAGTGTLKVYGAVANKAVAAGITQQVGTVTVSADVS